MHRKVVWPPWSDSSEPKKIYDDDDNDEEEDGVPETELMAGLRGSLDDPGRWEMVLVCLLQRTESLTIISPMDIVYPRNEGRPVDLNTFLHWLPSAWTDFSEVRAAECNVGKLAPNGNISGHCFSWDDEDPPFGYDSEDSDEELVGDVECYDGKVPKDAFLRYALEAGKPIPKFLPK